MGILPNTHVVDSDYRIIVASDAINLPGCPV